MTKRLIDLGLMFNPCASIFPPSNPVEEDYRGIQEIINSNQKTGSYTEKKINALTVGATELYLTDSGNIIAFSADSVTAHEFDPTKKQVVKDFDAYHSGGRGVYYKNKIYTWGRSEAALIEFDCKNYTEKTLSNVKFEPATIINGVIYSTVVHSSITGKTNISTYNLETKELKTKELGGRDFGNNLTAAFSLPNGDILYTGTGLRSMNHGNVFIFDRETLEIKKELLKTTNYYYGEVFSACWTPKGVFLTAAIGRYSDSIFFVDENGIKEYDTAREIMDSGDGKKGMRHFYLTCLLNDGRVFGYGEDGYVFMDVETGDYEYHEDSDSHRLTRACRDLNGNLYVFSSNGRLIYEFENNGYSPFTKEQLLSDYLNSGEVSYF